MNSSSIYEDSNSLLITTIWKSKDVHPHRTGARTAAERNLPILWRRSQGEVVHPAAKRSGESQSTFWVTPAKKQPGHGY